MNFQGDRWAEATVALRCLAYPAELQEMAARLPPEMWKTHIGHVWEGMIAVAKKGKPLNLPSILEEQVPGSYQGTIELGWKLIFEWAESTVVRHNSEFVEKAAQSIIMQYAETERARRLDKIGLLLEAGDYHAYLAELSALLRLEQSGNPSLETPSVEDMVELNRAELRTAESLVGDGLLNRSGLMWLHAPDGAGKTFLALQLASSMALGRPFLDEYDTKPVKVLYLQGELSREWWRERTKLLEEYERHRSATIDDVVSSRNLSFCHDRFPLARLVRNGRQQYIDMKGFGILEAMVRKERAEVVFIDPLSKFYSIEENNTDQNREFINRLLDLRRATGTTFVMVHHDRKSDRENEGQEMRGSSVLRADADSSLRLQAVTRKDKSSVFKKTETYLVWEKLRHARNPGRLQLQRCEDLPFFEKMGRR